MEQATRPYHQAYDPVCGRLVDVMTAAQAVHLGRTFYFDSLDCRDRFIADPHPYLTAEALREATVSAGGPTPAAPMRETPGLPSNRGD